MIMYNFIQLFYELSFDSALSINFQQVYVHNEALIHSARHNVVDGFLEMTDRFEDPVNITFPVFTTCFNSIVLSKFIIHVLSIYYLNGTATEVMACRPTTASEMTLLEDDHSRSGEW